MTSCGGGWSSERSLGFARDDEGWGTGVSHGGPGEVDQVAVAGEIVVVEKAPGVAAVADGIFGWDDGCARFEDVGAAWMKAAAAGGVGQVGRLAGHGRRWDGVVQAGQGREQQLA